MSLFLLKNHELVLAGYMNIFISRPNALDDIFEKRYAPFELSLKEMGFEPHTLGRNAYTLDSPLSAVINLMMKCSGAIILGYPQLTIHMKILRNNADNIDNILQFPTPWNQIEGVLAFVNKIPTLTIAHGKISGGIFDGSVTGKLTFQADLSAQDWHLKPDISAVLNLWKEEVLYGKG